jgi:hypothetical protein
MPSSTSCTFIAAAAPVMAVLLLGCADDGPGAGTAGRAELPDPVVLQVPAGLGVVYPFVAAARGEFIMSWTEPAEPGHALRFTTLSATDAVGSTLDGSTPGWSEVRTVATGDDWFVNWADFPSVVPAPDGQLGAHWLQRSGPGTYAYDVVIAQSDDGGISWSAPVRPHRDGTQTEHGFVSLFPHEGALAAVWLDGRRFAGNTDEEPSREMTVRFTTLRDGVPDSETLLDARACDCCQTTAVVTTDGPLVAYRDRTEDEIRDIVVTRLVDGAWTEPRTVHDDGWHITGCPVNGPQADATGRTVAIAWFTQADERPRVLAAFSTDAGARFSAPIGIDDGDPLGRVDLLLLDDGRALVVWLERAGEEADLRGRLVSADGTVGPSRLLARTSAQRASGFPRMARSGSAVLLAWTDATAQPNTVRAAVLDLGR